MNCHNYYWYIICSCVGVADLPYCHGDGRFPTCCAACGTRASSLIACFWSDPAWGACLHFPCHGDTMETKAQGHR